MGAEGSIRIVKRSVWDEKFPDVQPGPMGFYTGIVLGVDAVWSYFGEPDYEMVVEMYPKDSEREKEALEWFTGASELHEVWT